MIAGKNAKEKNRMIKNTIFIIFIFIGIVWFFLWTIDRYSKKGYIYIIPQGYKGKLSIVFNQKGKLPLKEKDGYIVVRFPLNGFVETSSIPRTGKQKNKYFLYTKDGSLIPATTDKNFKLGGGMTTQEKDNFIFEFFLQ